MTFFFSEYYLLYLFFILSFFLSSVILALSGLLSYSSSYYDKVSPYECGFDPFDNARNQFEIHFYLVAILFLIFDLEASFLFPWASNLNVISGFGFWVIIDFLFELIVGLVYVWISNALNWEL
ncbi:NADH-quinone oxidoreductase subunit A [PVC group bacterium (ex Bugula neritina AB1)]|nr:NADH-quinone oxidoreductase subunit A [PVC group bacterium (ex Bugula neritina AB1)]